MRHDLKQRQVVERIAVKKGFLEVDKVPIEPGEPVVDPNDFAMLEARRARDLAGVATGNVFGIRGDEVRHAERARNRRGDEAVRGGHHRTEIASGKVFAHEFDRLLCHGGADHPLHEILVPGSEQVRRVRRQQAQHEFRSLFGSEVAGVIALHELFVAAQGDFRVARPPGLCQVLRPLVIAVEWQQRVVQIEERESFIGHDWRNSRSASIERSSGTVTARCLDSE